MQARQLNTPPPPKTTSRRPTEMLSAHEAVAARRRGERSLFVTVLCVLLAATFLVFSLGSRSTVAIPAALGILGALGLVALIMWRPVLMFYFLTIAAVAIEEQPLSAGSVLTDQLPVFNWPSAALAGQPERPIGYLLLLTLLVLIARRFIRRAPVLYGGELIGAFAIFLLCVLLGVGQSFASGGDFKITVVEVRPFWYMFISYLLACNVVTRKSHVRAFMWMVILGGGLKSVQMLYLVFIKLHGSTEGLRVIMATEDSYFWICLLVVVLVFRLNNIGGRQLRIGLILVPAVIYALFANNRRADFVALIVGIVAAGALIYQVRPEIRRRLLVVGGIVGVLFTGYVLAFGHSTSSIGKPAYSIMSVIQPSAANDANSSDASSNLYREIENFDTQSTVKASPIVGIGFGKPFLQPVKLVDLSSLDEYYNIVPHNNVYWVWLSLGGVGFVAFLFLVGSIIVRGGVIARTLRDPYLQSVAIIAVVATVMEVIVAYADYNLFFYRNVIYLGLFAGVLVRLPWVERNDPTIVAEEAGTREPTA